MGKIRCDQCRFWVRQGDDEGQCHRRAPVPDPTKDGDIRELLQFIADEIVSAASKVGHDTVAPEANGPTWAFWPMTHDEDWCGEWEAKP